ncbi:MAG: phosphoribosyl-AMP cyclohydrolase [Candidatus Omnitrophica bacterium]|nr:phosphoribosyl-AMP cyclohydrolase [Candidatus Omnitrophota bacterium]
MCWIKDVKFKGGLVPAVIQDYKTDEVVMVAYMNKQALKKTIETKKCYYYSRSRKKLWLKGETSGHIQKVKSIFIDCDMDCVLIKVQQVGGACHTGYRSCFFRKAAGSSLKTVGKKVFDPKKVY